MAKKIRGKIRPLVRAMRPDGRLHWRKQKTLAVIAGRRIYMDNPLSSIEVEIEMEHLAGFYLVAEDSTAGTPNYITTE
jgi:hypothetical protein